MAMNATVTWKHDNAFEGVGSSTDFKVAIGGRPESFEVDRIIEGHMFALLV